MWPFDASDHKYHTVASDEVELKDGGESERPRIQTQPVNARRPFLRIAVACLLLILVTWILFAIVATHANWFGSQSAKTPTEAANLDAESPSPSGSLKCPQRREWRSVSSIEKQDYISAVLCLRNTSSTLAPKSKKTAYDDYPWIHSHVGYFTHHSATFLPWHRYLLHIYEMTLREQCGYGGTLVYWDWTLDSDAIENSPVFDADTGFGGDGEVGGEITVSRTGRCVVDGPFAGITAEYYDVKYQPHCLSRGFRDLEGNLGHIDGSEITPESIEEVLSLDKYEDFVALMESRGHDAIPYGISGDFETFTAPYDPLFFLHHTQLDRLWWLWQQRQPGGGLEAYGGHKQRHSIEMASLNDAIDMQGLAPSVHVAALMNVESELLCYTY